MSGEAVGDDVIKVRKLIAEYAPNLIERLCRHLLENGPNLRKIPNSWCEPDRLQLATAVRMLRDAGFITGGPEAGNIYSQVPPYIVTAMTLAYRPSEDTPALAKQVGRSEDSEVVAALGELLFERLGPDWTDFRNPTAGESAAEKMLVSAGFCEVRFDTFIEWPGPGEAKESSRPRYFVATGIDAYNAVASIAAGEPRIPAGQRKAWIGYGIRDIRLTSEGLKFLDDVRAGNVPAAHIVARVRAAATDFRYSELHSAQVSARLDQLAALDTNAGSPMKDEVPHEDGKTTGNSSPVTLAEAIADLGGKRPKLVAFLWGKRLPVNVLDIIRDCDAWEGDDRPQEESVVKHYRRIATDWAASTDQRIRALSVEISESPWRVRIVGDRETDAGQKKGQ